MEFLRRHHAKSTRNNCCFRNVIRFFPSYQPYIIFWQLRIVSLTGPVLTIGINILHATNIHETPLASAVPRLCQESAALYKICLALQCYTHPDLNADFLDFYNDGLIKFRSELSVSSTAGLRESNLLSGLLLCTIEVSPYWYVRLSAVSDGNYLAHAWHTLDFASRRDV
jgi:hypothetical protein